MSRRRKMYSVMDELPIAQRLSVETLIFRYRDCRRVDVRENYMEVVCKPGTTIRLYKEDENYVIEFADQSGSTEMYRIDLETFIIAWRHLQSQIIE